MELHPSGFVETGGCAGPRYIRDQPSRESPGILLTTDKYVAEFDLPFRNMMRYIKEIEEQWPKLDARQRELVANSLAMFSHNGKIQNKQPQENFYQNKKESFAQTESVDDVLLYISQDPSLYLTNVLDEILNPSDQFKDLLANNYGGANVDAKIKDFQKTLSEWCYARSYHHVNWATWVIFVIIILLILFLGIGAGYNIQPMPK